ncbi:lipopolysaccharide biosynthesis protein [Bacillus sp. FJAT-26390]|uniref:lipopolysaccharide biosynthesis protein n=1 Tax=Bacillus sp. FJAT-26390 TaxID=1743142 RepID=UPI000807E7C1|nr:oligosaccharide flippase family protein [Bacillus sp. FJAT-26390]OBZ11223.1 hypothetical protein A7975_19915 [Bacillus sp. FJAT-26390]
MEEKKIYKLGIQNIMYSITSQALSFLLSIVTGFILPITMGVADYGYWQVYLFYIGFIMLFCFGFNDGLYLRYGSYNYNQLPFDKLRIAMRIFIIAISITTGILLVFSFRESDPNKVFAFCAISINLIILGINGTLLTVLQFTNRIKLNSFLTIANKLIFVIIIVPLLLIDWVDFRVIIIADIITKLFVLAFNIYKSNELFRGHTATFSIGIKEYWDDISIGISLMFANIVGSLLIGVGRFIVERYMSLETYSLYSFATTITTFALIFIAAASMSLYPLLKRVMKQKLPVIYVELNQLLCIGLFFLLAGYYPLHYLIKNYYTSFNGILEYFYLLFIIVVSQGKMQFMINTYYKVLREEKAMLIANLSSVVFAILAIIPAFYFTHSIFSIVIGTTVTLIWRCYASEFFLKKKMGITSYSNMIIELSMIILFVITIISFKPVIGFFIFFLINCGNVFINRSLLRRFIIKVYKSVKV